MAGADDEVTAMGGRVLLIDGVGLGGLVVEVAVVVAVADVGCTLLGVTKSNEEAASCCSTERGLTRDASSSLGVLGDSSVDLNGTNVSATIGEVGCRFTSTRFSNIGSLRPVNISENDLGLTVCSSSVRWSKFLSTDHP